ncbi:MAG: hypothetical protein NC308_11785 [Clostridium sp.]|nr:hypothetical protein [Bacteroides sp.]MCM1199559.1 hypothetical protein [Clostridium sp.]
MKASAAIYVNLKLNILLLALGLALPVCLSAQDYIHTVDTKPIAAKVTEIGEEYVIYRTYDNLNGPDYRISTWRILKIVFENGTEKIFAHTGPYAVNPFETTPYYAAPSCHGHALRYHKGHYYYENERLRNEQIADYIGYSLYGTGYLSAKRKYSWGFVLTCLGAGSLAMGITIHSFAAASENFASENFAGYSTMHEDGGRNNSEYIGAATCYIIGAGGLGAGIPLLVKGQRGLRKIADDYNRNYGTDSKGYSLNIGTTRSGVGLSLNF